MKNKQEKLYNNLKQKLLDINYASNSLLEKAEVMRKEDHRYDEKIEKISNYLAEKMSHGDGVAYALLYAAPANDIKKLLKPYTTQEFIEFLKTTKFAEPDLTYEFFDPKVAYIASDLSGAVEQEGGTVTLD